jgi:hypothetical protein
MSIQYCDYCGINIDTDFDAEHFICQDIYTCVMEEMDNEDN